MNTQAIEFLRNTFTSNTAPTYSNNPDGIDVFTVPRKDFKKFIKDEEVKFMCSFKNMSSRTNNRSAKNEEYLSRDNVDFFTRSTGDRAGRPSPLFAAV
jgi:hypothetical protein